MEVVNPRESLLSNFEVLTLLRELEKEQLAETRVALAVKKEPLQNGQTGNELPFSTFTPNQPPIPEVCENLRTVEFEAIAHLTAPFQPTARQTVNGITKLTRDLRKYNLTKAEKLQIVNLAPVQAVELYVIVEELEDRLSNEMDDILRLVENSLTEIPGSEEDAEVVFEVERQHQGYIPDARIGSGQGHGEEEEEVEEEMGWENDEFVDDEGGFEGDLEAGDDGD